MTILSAATLENCNVLYEKSGTYKLNTNKMYQLINNMQSKYSPMFQQIVMEMLTQPNARKSCSEIYHMLYPYEKDILDL